MTSEPSADAPTVKIKKLEFDKSEVLPQLFLNNLQAEYPEGKYTLDDIKGLLEKINNYYVKNGYLTSRAYVQAQDLANGVLKISLFEGKIGDVLPQDNQYTSDAYILEALDFPQAQVLNLNDLEQKIAFFNAANESKTKIALRPGQAVGTTDIDAVVSEPQRFSASAFTDNAGSHENGRYRVGLFTSVRKVMPFDLLQDKLNLGGITSRGSDAIFASYDVTEPYWLTTWTAGVDWSNSEIVAGDLRSLDVNGNFYNYYISVKRPFSVRDDMIVTAGLRANTKHGKNYVSDYKVQDVNTDTVSIFTDVLYLFNNGYWYNNFEATQAAKIRHGDNSFAHFNYNGELQVGFADAFAFNVKGRAQYSNDNFMPSSDQFQIGGSGSVRGYSEGMLIGDSGISFMNEIKYALPADGNWLNNAEAFVFYDFGQVWTDYEGQMKKKNETFIYSTGLGLRADVINRFSGTFTMAFPLKKHDFNDNKRGLEVLFNLQAKLY